MKNNFVLYLLVLTPLIISFFVFIRNLDNEQTWKIVASTSGFLVFLFLSIIFLIQQKKKAK
ncbi:hypothetical protein AV926_07000 [Myroides marinus]|uniref:Uncharacterized protein n=1 Tax=Myroides marinus TaxID=703342 RepID=A0A161U9G3_9FLAO|nr:hypothetical protein AS361_16255 [Myroides marinus]KZE82606.1 hypothetical protein AV926_07000 [Myroides marinus]